MGQRVSLAGIIQPGRLIKPQGVNPKTLRISPIGRSLKCMGAVLIGPGTNQIVIGCPTPLPQTAAVTIEGTEEGLAYKGVGTSARFEATMAISPATNGVENTSIVARVKPNSPGGLVYAVSYGSGLSRQLSVGFNASSQSTVSIEGGSGNNTTSGSTTVSGYITLGASANASGANSAPILYENGVLIGTGSTVNQTTTYAASPLICLGAKIGGGSNNLAGWVSWAFVFNQKLDADQHFFVAKNPWALLEFVESDLVGKPSSGAVTIQLTQATWKWSGQALGTNAQTEKTLTQVTWKWSGQAAGTNATTQTTLTQTTWRWSAQAINVNATTMKTLTKQAWVWAGQALQTNALTQKTLTQATWKWVGQPITISVQLALELTKAAWQWFARPIGNNLQGAVLKLLMLLRVGN